MNIKILLFVAAVIISSCKSHSYYDLLGVDQTASYKEIKKAYHAKALLLHPDKKHINKKDTTLTEFIDVQEAYSVLKSNAKRQEYDKTLHMSRSVPTHDGWHFDGLNWEFRAEPGASIDLAEAMRVLRVHQANIQKERERNLNSIKKNTQPMFSNNSNVKRLTLNKMPGFGKHLQNKHAWIILACTQTKKNCRRHESVFQELAERLRLNYGGPSVRVGFIDCGKERENNACISLLNISKTSLIYIRSYTRRKQKQIDTAWFKSVTIKGNSKLSVETLFQFAIQASSSVSNKK